MAITIQTGGHQFTQSDITKYSLFMGGLNATHDALKQYDPLTTGNYRIFMVRKPKFVEEYFKVKTGLSKFDAFKHILEYGNTAVSGIGTPSVDFDEVKGGYAGRSFQIPKSATDDTNELSIKVYEFSGSIMREVLHTWINGGIDLNSGLTHYNGLIASGEVQYSQANQTAEFIYVVTDRTGMKVEYACMFANCFPKEIPTDHFNSDAGEHNLVSFDVKFSTTKYEGYDVNIKAQKLLKMHQIMTNSLEFYTGLNGSAWHGNQTGYNPKTGNIELVSGSTVGAGTANAVDYRSKLTTTDASVTQIGRNKTDPLRPTPSYTDIGNRR